MCGFLRKIQDYFSSSFMEKRLEYTGLDHPFGEQSLRKYAKVLY